MRIDLELARGSGGAVVRSAVGGCRDVLTWRSSPRLEIIWAELDVTCRGLESVGWATQKKKDKTLWR